MSAYFDALSDAMERLGDDPRTIFLGQGVRAPGTFMSATLAGVPERKRLELPVAEEMQLGMTLGLALQGFVPVSIYPRWNFLILAANQLVSHLDKVALVSDWRPTAIVRVGIGASKPLDPGPQHVGDMTDAFRLLLSTVRVVRLDRTEDIAPAYRDAMNGGITLMVEHAALY